MRKGLKWKLISGLTLISSLFICAGCKLGESFADLKEKLDWDARVTYYANSVGTGDAFKTDGQFENTQGVKDMYYKAGSYAARIGEKEIGNVKMTHYAHAFEGWYHVDKDEQGRLLFVDKDGEKLYQGEDGRLYYAEKEGNPVLTDESVATVPVRSDEKVDFSKTLADGDHWSICADWEEMSRLHIKLACEDLEDNEKIAGTSMDSKDVEYENGALVWEDFFENEEDKVQSLGMAPFTASENAFTFVEYYKDEACTQIVSWPIAWNENDQVIYAKYIKGEWEILKNTEDVKSKLFMSTKVSATDKFYLIQDIDCTDVSVAPFEKFEGQLQGNGFTLSNLQVTLGQRSSRLDGGKSVALFGQICKTAKIENVRFENIAVEYPTKSKITTWTCYFLFTQFDLGASVSDVAITGTFKFKLGDENAKPMNVAQNAENWKYGTVQDGADSSGFDMSGVSAPTFEI